MDYDVFLSHNSKDKPAVEAIGRKLQETYGLRCWLDKWNLIPGEPWQEALEKALGNCQTVAVFIGPRSISPWENEEMRSALEEHIQEKRSRVIPILLPGALDKSSKQLPRFLKRVTWVDFREGLEDQNALYNLYCGIKGISPGAGKEENETQLLENQKVNNAFVQIILDGSLNNFNKKRKDDIVLILSRLLEINERDIRILEVIQGSVILKIELPMRSSKKLMMLAEKKDVRLLKLGIRSIQVGNESPIILIRGDSFKQKWNEFWGRKSVMEPIPFTETSIMTQPVSINVGFFGYFLRLPPNSAAIIRSSTDQTHVFTEGGYIDLQEGAYTLQYIDTSDRFFTFTQISAPTLDTDYVSMTLSIFYKITDPSLLKNNPTPLRALFVVCEGAIKNFIATHRYNELIGEQDNQYFLSDHHIVQHIKEQVELINACKVFLLKDVIVEERLGKTEIEKLQKAHLTQGSQNLIQKEGVLQQQEIAEQQKILERTRAEQDIMIKEMQALYKANRSEILKQAHILEVELEAMEKQPNLQQKQILKMIDVKKQALESLLHLYKIAGFPRDQNDLILIDRILGSLSETQIVTAEVPLERSKFINELNITILNLITSEGNKI